MFSNLLLQWENDLCLMILIIDFLLEKEIFKVNDKNLYKCSILVYYGEYMYNLYYWNI